MNPEFQPQITQMNTDEPAAEKHLRSSVLSAAKEKAAPKISAIVPVYKVEKYLPECIESVLAQTFTDFELILVDDGSPDNSGAICDAYAARDPRIRVFHKPNGGVSSARNLGLDHARGEWIAFVDSDDKLFPNALHDLTTAAEAHPDADLVEGMFVRENGQNPFSSNAGEKKIFSIDTPTYLESLCTHTQYWITAPWGKIFKKEVFLHAHALDISSQFFWGEDFLMLLKFSKVASVFVKVESPLYWYRHNTESASKSKSRSAAYYVDWLTECERLFPENTEGKFRKAWLTLIRNYFLLLFLWFPEWEAKTPFEKKIIEQLYSARNTLSIGTKLCVYAARLRRWRRPAQKICYLLFLAKGGKNARI